MAAPTKHPRGYERPSPYLNPEEMELVRHYSKIWRMNLSDTIRRCILVTLSGGENDLLAREEMVRMKLSEHDAQGNAYRAELAEIQKIKAKKLEEKNNIEKNIEFAHMKLLESFKTNYFRIDLIPENAFKFYSDLCGESVDKLKEWLRQEILKLPTPKSNDVDILIVNEPEPYPRNSIEFAHMKLLKSLKTNYSGIDMMPEGLFKVYSDRCGESVDKLKEWLRNEIQIRGRA